MKTATKQEITKEEEIDRLKIEVFDLNEKLAAINNAAEQVKKEIGARINRLDELRNAA